MAAKVSGVAFRSRLPARRYFLPAGAPGLGLAGVLLAVPAAWGFFLSAFGFFGSRLLRF
jgi:hypothetical protein